MQHIIPLGSILFNRTESVYGNMSLNKLRILGHAMKHFNFLKGTSSTKLLQNNSYNVMMTKYYKLLCDFQLLKLKL